MSRLTVHDYETGQDVGVIHADGTLDFEDEVVREFVAEELLDDEGRALVPVAGSEPDEGDEPVLVDGAVRIGPGETGFLWAIADALPHPYTAEADGDLEQPDV